MYWLSHNCFSNRYKLYICVLYNFYLVFLGPGGDTNQHESEDKKVKGNGGNEVAGCNMESEPSTGRHEGDELQVEEG